MAKTHKDEAQPSWEPPFPKGYPHPGTANGMVRLVESMLTERARDLGIQEVALGDANLPLDGAFRRDMLLPVLVDYANQVIFRQSELKFESALTDELSTGIAAEHAASEDREPTEDDLEVADTVIEPILKQSLFSNHEDRQAGLQVRTHATDFATMPVSVSLLIMDTALESAYHLSQSHQQNTLGHTEREVLDLSPTYDFLTQLQVEVPTVPTALQSRLHDILDEHPTPQEGNPATKTANLEDALGLDEAPEDPEDLEEQTES